MRSEIREGIFILIQTECVCVKEDAFARTHCTVLLALQILEHVHGGKAGVKPKRKRSIRPNVILLSRLGGLMLLECLIKANPASPDHFLGRVVNKYFPRNADGFFLRSTNVSFSASRTFFRAKPSSSCCGILQERGHVYLRGHAARSPVPHGPHLVCARTVEVPPPTPLSWAFPPAAVASPGCITERQPHPRADGGVLDGGRRRPAAGKHS